jgi:hypothetical protein
VARLRTPAALLAPLATSTAGSRIAGQRIVILPWVTGLRGGAAGVSAQYA